jgi:hypothetical protein
MEFANPVRIAHTSTRSMQSESSGTPNDPSGGQPPK